MNPAIEKHSVVKLLWREEALQVLRELNADAGVRSKPRKQIYERLAATADLDFIREKTRYYLGLRTAREVVGPQTSGDD